MYYRTGATLVLAIAGLVATAAAAQAAPTHSVRVAYADLDLTHEAGVAALYSRLRQAASTVCNPSDTIHPLDMVSYRACAAKALDDAVSTVNDPKLTAVHARWR